MARQCTFGLINCSVCNTYPPAKENAMTAITVALDTKNNSERAVKSAEAKLKQLKNERASTRIEVDAVTYSSDPYGYLSLSVPPADPNKDGTYAVVHMNAADLEALQNAVFAARVKLDKATTKLTNQKLADALGGYVVAAKF